MKRTTLSLLVAAGLIVPILGGLTASQLQAEVDDRASFRRDDRGDRVERLITELELTDTQVEQIQTIRQEARDEMETLHTTLRAEHQALHTLMAGDATETELRTQHEQVQSLHQAVANQRFNTMLAVRAVLTPEQRSELAALMEQRRDRYRDEHGFRRHDGRPRLRF